MQPKRSIAKGASSVKLLIQRLIAMRRESKGRGGWRLHDRRLHDAFPGAILLPGGTRLNGQKGETAYFLWFVKQFHIFNETYLDSLALWAFQFFDA